VTVSGCVVDVDPFADEFLADPWADLERIRDAGPAAFLPAYGVWAVARHEEVRAILKDAATFSSAAGIGYLDVRQEPFRSPSLVLETDRPLHTRTRRVLGKVLGDSALRTLKPRFTAEAERLADSLAGRGEFDAVRDLAQPYPLKVFGDAVGLSPQDRERLLEYGAMAFDANGPRNPRFQAAVDDVNGTVAWTMRSCARESLSPGGFGAAIYRAADAGAVSEDEALLLVRSLLSAGIDTTVSAFAFAALAFARHPGQWSALRRDPALVRPAVEEILRFEPPFMGVFRMATRPAPIGEVTVEPDTKVLLLLAGACRDPRRWQDPDRFDIGRDAGGHTAFGHGIHRCVGHAVARLELETMLTALLGRVANWSLTGPPVPRLNNSLRGLASLPVYVTAA
jgi:cytochrome P450